MDRRIVCAALRNCKSEQIILGVRHYDKFMRAAKDWYETEQGFVDQFGTFHTREEAHVIAKAAGQITRRVGGDEITLYSENLY